MRWTLGVTARTSESKVDSRMPRGIQCLEGRRGRYFPWGKSVTYREPAE